MVPRKAIHTLPDPQPRLLLDLNRLFHSGLVVTRDAAGELIHPWGAEHHLTGCAHPRPKLRLTDGAEQIGVVSVGMSISASRIHFLDEPLVGQDTGILNDETIGRIDRKCAQG